VGSHKKWAKVQVKRRRVRRCGQAERHRTCTESGASARDMPVVFQTPKSQLLGPATLNSSPRAMMAVGVPGAKTQLLYRFSLRSHHGPSKTRVIQS